MKLFVLIAALVTVIVDAQQTSTTVTTNCGSASFFYTEEVGGKCTTNCQCDGLRTCTKNVCTGTARTVCPVVPTGVLPSFTNTTATTCQKSGTCCQYNTNCLSNCCQKSDNKCALTQPRSSTDRAKCLNYTSPQLDSENTCPSYLSSGAALLVGGALIAAIVIPIIIGIGCIIVFTYGGICMCRICARNSTHRNEIFAEDKKLVAKLEMMKMGHSAQNSVSNFVSNGMNGIG